MFAVGHGHLLTHSWSPPSSPLSAGVNSTEIRQNNILWYTADAVLPCGKDVFTGNNNNRVFHVFMRSYKHFSPLRLSHTLISQSLQTNIFCSLVVCDWYHIKSSQLETWAKAAVKFCVEHTKIHRNNSVFSSPFPAIKDSLWSREVQLKEFKGWQPKQQHPRAPLTQHQDTEGTTSSGTEQTTQCLTDRVEGLFLLILELFYTQTSCAAGQEESILKLH